MVVEHGLALRKQVVDAVPHLVGDGRHVAQVAGEVQKQVRRERRGHPHAERAAALAGTGHDVHTLPGEEGVGELSELFGEAAVRLNRHGARFLEAVFAVALGEGGVDVGVFQPRHAEEPCFQAEVFLCQGVVFLGDLHEAFDHLVGDLVTEVGRLHRVPVVSELHLLGVVKRHVVEHCGIEDAVFLVLLEEGAEGALAQPCVRVMQKGKQFLAGHLFGLPAHLEGVAQGGGDLVEETAEGLHPGQAFLRKQALLPLGKGVRLELPPARKGCAP